MNGVPSEEMASGVSVYDVRKMFGFSDPGKDAALQEGTKPAKPVFNA